MEIPKIIYGGNHLDERGTLLFNNNFDASEVKRIYFIENKDVNFVRGWIGHKIEQRWFSAVAGTFIIKLVKIDNWIEPDKQTKIIEFELDNHLLNILHIPQGYATAIQAKEDGSRLLVMANYLLGEIDDQYRFDIDYFEN
ncbi:WxcM-like domain-containing protein [Chryseobacterium salviniae]|uniref:WxcM-like domain-containing protein n=1 Tax=Chryseobacterium salviniae TaxID=3101750 RepID=A0ABU6HX13_9FLAO|nr:WxcM-like domain-containing protein [Chryseobacterium sp. T9W2-O]MEC3877606.1 WxcM-like domain-containing protein [Chryseobacterium sp. T9W2-O]